LTKETWLRPYAADTEKSRKILEGGCQIPKGDAAAQVAKALIASLPKDAKSIYFGLRVAGGGSLGRPRSVAVAFWRGGHILREAKALVPSAWTWAHGGKSKASHFRALANGKYRAPDPFLAVHGKFIYRRIAADARKIELADVGGSKIKRNILQAMGFDLASIHAAGAPGASALRADLKKRPHGWLNAAAKTAVAAVKRDFAEWRN
jgi:hypothetical protein